jgi:peptide/nickel transport system substrate-binding protein
MMTGWRVLVALLALGAGLLAGAGPAPAAEKVAVVGVGTTFINLNPLTHIVSTMRVTNNMLFDGLTRFDDATYQPKPDLAESWTVSGDGLEYVFKLRRGVVFHDGGPFTAHDVKFSWQVICHGDNLRMTDAYIDHYVQIRGCPDYRQGKAESVEGIEVVDDHTLRVRLTEPYAPFLVSTAVTGILPRAKYQAIAVKDLMRHPLSRAPIGTGPFMYADWKEGDRLVLRANPRYFRGKPKLDGVIIRFILDPAARLLEFRNGTLHFAFFAPVRTEDFEAARSDPRLAAKAYDGVWNYLFIVDHTNPLFQDVRVRQALAHAFDRAAILREVWGGHGALHQSLIDPHSFAFAKLPVPAYDPAKARALLREAGWTPGPDGVLQKDGKRFEFSILNWPGAVKDMAVVYQDALKKIGMAARLETIDFPTIWGVRFRPGKFEALSFPWPSGFYPDPGVGLYAFLCANTRTGYCSKESETLIVKGRTTLDPKERAKIYTQLQQLWARDLPVIPIVSPADLRLASARLVLPDRQNDFLVMKSIVDWDLKE